MRRLNGRELKALFVLSIVVPVGVLVSLRLTGVLQEPIIISETIPLETIKWTFERPNQTVDIFKVVETFYNNDGLTANPKIHIWDYVDRPYGGYYFDCLYMAISINSTITNQDGFIESVYVILNKDQSSQINWMDTDFHFENLSLLERVYGYKSNMQAYVKLTGANHSNSVYFSSRVDWSLISPNNQTHQMEVAYELTYFNGTVYKKVVQPFQLRIIGG